MAYSTTTARPFAIGGPALPSPLGGWLRSLFARAPRAAAPRDRVAEAAKVRAYAMAVRESEPAFAADLFAAADRHEFMQD